MARKIEIEWPAFKTSVSATLLEKDASDICDMLWADLSTPQKMFAHHTLSTGGMYIAKGRPAKHPTKAGTQLMPIGAKKWMLSKFKPGMLAYRGNKEIFVVYGPTTEALEAGGPPVAKVDQEDLDKFKKVGEAIWNAQYITHTLVTMITRRKEA